MTPEEAISLIKEAVPESDKPQRWADLGCGNGVFTNALANLLPEGSYIYAVDNTLQHLPTVMGNHGVGVEFIKADFEKAAFNFSDLDGILMANSLHYCKDKRSVLQKLDEYLSADKRFLIVEYDTAIANQWVPYPVDFAGLKDLFAQFDTREIRKIAERRFIFGQGNLYTAIISFVTQ